ncbi:MAG: ATP-binding protein [Bacteroidales bacterium]|jgi:anti-sigma regulatory factor (Ser/Thr protein kinase)|nr:ATP-binding protein [Bacteroidales bacterium]MDD2570247.1 ATP-binding protein [Bacteroidales bacterium]MDD2811843.1 ATP-binding protein [Bacteroidales bacterium]MDD3384359.1 ATP-binding protein [Bacteroidales bacterium]MDD3810734.1 ATP-binding protein [Bacteroidales bacterium]
MEYSYTISGGDFTHAGEASSHLKRILKSLNLDPVLIRRTVVALYEAEVNVVAHAWNGKVMVDISPDEIVIVVKDAGPGIEDIERAMQKGYSTASPTVREMGFGAGMGLFNMKSNSDSLEIKSDPGVGTEVRIVNKIS